MEATGTNSYMRYLLWDEDASTKPNKFDTANPKTMGISYNVGYLFD